ncbi:hypothetical protein [Spirosoma sp. 209]|uniref:dioxygenase family protein n=1 Tax=Spirosoma sp. 209 TaxID=1955701 RepID=UPI001F475275|nr:hypothetical protein [Spirosoma sp. 209]
MKSRRLLLLLICLVARNVTGQTQRVGGPCEGCEAIHESPVPFDKLTSFLTMSDATWTGNKPLSINGTVYKADGKPPAPGVVLYVYHTDQTGRYVARQGARGWERRHGSLRGWMRTNEQGEYKFVTLRPAPYPMQTSRPTFISLSKSRA